MDKETLEFFVLLLKSLELSTPILEKSSSKKMPHARELFARSRLHLLTCGYSYECEE
jgi:hypothetical protein